MSTEKNGDQDIQNKSFFDDADFYREKGPSIDITTLASSDVSPAMTREPTLEQHDSAPEEQHSSRNPLKVALNAIVARTRKSFCNAERPSGFTAPKLASVPRRHSLSALERGQSNEPLTPAKEVESSSSPVSQGVPAELGNFIREIVFVVTCSSGQLLFTFLNGDINVNQQAFKAALGLSSTQLPWLVGSFLVALGLTVIIAGSLTDLASPRIVVISAFAWLTVWNVVGCFCNTPSLSILWFIMRAMQGLGVGTLISASLSILGRIYKPGLRKIRVFSAMAAMAPCGFWLGTMHGGALSAHLPWVFGSNAIFSGLLCAAAYFTIPNLQPAVDKPGAEIPNLRHFDFKGATCALIGCICLLFGLTQGSVTNWAPYTYALIIVGIVVLGLFFWVETRVARPMIPSRLWKTPSFGPLMAAYFLGFGSYIGAFQFYSIQFFLRMQHASPITTALYFLPSAILGVLATFVVSKSLHVVPGHYIYIASMVFFALGPAFFIPQTPSTSYWALSMPGIAIATFGPDMSFAAASVFITSNVARSYQGSAGSLLVTVQNLSTAIMTSLSTAIGSSVDSHDGEIGMEGLRAIWWFAMGSGLLGAVITVVAVRIPKEEERDHVT